MNKKVIPTSILVVVLIGIAIYIGVYDWFHYSGYFNLLRSMIYIGLFIAWGLSIRKRVLQPQVKGYLTAIAALMIFWMSVRTMRFLFVYDRNVSCYLWYSYYIPMLSIPLLGLFVSVSLGKANDFRLPKWSKLLFISTMIHIVLVLTNNLHQLVFSFSKESSLLSLESYRYEIMYYVVAAWTVLYSFTAVVIIIRKCRIPRTKKILWMPMVPLFVAIIYCILYAMGFSWLRETLGDLTVFVCLMVAAILESCIQCGMIQSNTGYDVLFHAGTFRAQILNHHQEPCYFSANAPVLPGEGLGEIEGGTIRLDKNTLLKSQRIEGGCVVWCEDITEIVDIMEKLEENRKNIAERVFLEQEQYNTKLQINSLREKNRLYDLLQEQTAHQIELIDQLLARYHSEINQEEQYKLLAQIAVVGSYIKRRGNLIYIGEKSNVIDITELAFCMEETLANLELLNVECGMDISPKAAIWVRDAIGVYDFFETVIERAMNDIRSVWMKSRYLKDSILFRIEIECETDLSDLSDCADQCTGEDNIWSFGFFLGKSGEQV